MDPGYWDVTTLYALGRALAAERMLALEGIHVVIAEQFPELADSMRGQGVDEIVRDAFHQLFHYHRLALAESCLISGRIDFSC